MVTAPGTPRSTRIKELLLASACALAGVGFFGLSLVNVLPSLSALASHAPLIEFQPHDTLGFFVGIACMAFCLLFLGPPAGWLATTKGRAGQNPGLMRWAGLWLIVSVASVLLGLFSSGIAQLAFELTVERADYHLCPRSKTWEHHPPLRWVRAEGRCP